MKSSNAKLSIRGFKFGVEIESNIDSYGIKKNLKFEPGWRHHNEHCGSEIVSPILYGYKGMMSLRTQLRHLWKWKNKIKFANCGLHVHVDIQNFNLGQAKRLVLLASRFDQTLFCMLDGCRWNNTYARRCVYDEKKVNEAKSLRDVQNMQANGRYSGLNLHAFSKHGTVEFRYAMGSADWRRIYSLTSLYLRMVASAASNMEIPVSNTVEKFGPNSSGLKDAKKNLAILQENKETFFDFLQIRGETRKSLDIMFDANVLDTAGRQYKTADELTETRDKIKFSLKRDK
jgi:hypothetical protein